MKIYSAFLAALCSPCFAYVPSLSGVARSLAHIDGRTDLNQLWNNLQGDTLIASAIATSERDQIQAAVLLAGTVLSDGVKLGESSAKIAALCEIILSKEMVEEFFSEKEFQEKRQKLIEVKRTATSDFQLKQAATALFPFANLHYVCGNDLPLDVKLGIFKARVVKEVVSRTNNYDVYMITLPNCRSYSLEDSMKLLMRSNNWLRNESNESALIFNVRYEEAPSLVHDSPTSYWLSRVFQKMFPSIYFQPNPNGDYSLVPNASSVRHPYSALGQMLGLAIMNNVGIPAALEPNLLHALLTDTLFDESSARSRDMQSFQKGFHSVVSREALFGNDRSPRTLFNENELRDIFLRKNVK